MSKQHIFKSPPHINNTRGEERKVGYEFEFTGVEMADAAGMIQSIYGGEIQEISPFEYLIKDTSFGEFKLEIDAQLLYNKKYEPVLKKFGVDLSKFKQKQKIEEALRDMASSVVPFEIITPPIPVSEMHQLNKLVDHLRQWKAKGTTSSFFYAFGLHLNPEVSSTSSADLLNHIRAYAMLDPWIRKDAEIDLSRRMTPYIDEFKTDYLKRILNPDYKPGLQQLIIDYIKYDNSRNRALDMLPVFSWLDKETVKKHIEDELTSARPTFHYRLPNCSIDDKEWSLAAEWNRWVLVEKMASDEKNLLRYAKTYLQMKNKTVFRFETKWVELINRWISNDS